MTFHDLPQNWTTLPVSTTPGRAADIVDLVLSLADRLANSLLLLWCDGDGRALPTPLMIGDIDWAARADVRRTVLANAATVAPMVEARSVIVALGSATLPDPRRLRGWADDAANALDAEGCTVTACVVATLDAVFEIPVGGADGARPADAADHARGAVD